MAVMGQSQRLSTTRWASGVPPIASEFVQRKMDQGAATSLSPLQNTIAQSPFRAHRKSL